MKRYEYVIVIGVDGMGNFNQVTPTPNIDRIFKNGATTQKALSMLPTISAQNWGGMLLGCDPVVHRLTNSIVGSRLYESSENPSVFKRIREVYPQARLASYCNWNPINYGIIEHNLNVDFETADNDAELTEKIIRKISEKPEFMFIQLDNVDGAGHRYGYGKQGHLDEITRADSYVGRIYDEYVRNGMIDDTLFIVTADHGGFKNSHGGYADTEKYVFLGAKGKGVCNGEIGTAFTKDISSIVLYAFGIDIPPYCDGGYTSQVPKGLFENYSEDYIVPSPKAFDRKQIKTVPYRAENGIGTHFADRVKLAMFFDNSVKDESENCVFREDGVFKFYSDGPVSFCGEGGANGCAITDDLLVGEDSFSVSLWVETSLLLVEEASVCGNKYWDEENDDDKGWCIVLRSHDILFFLADGDHRFETTVPFEERSEDGWVHFMASVDKKNKIIDFYRDFQKILTVEIEDRYMINLDNRPFTLGNDSALKYNNVLYTKTVRMDDLLVLDGALGEEDVSFLKKYYREK